MHAPRVLTLAVALLCARVLCAQTPPAPFGEAIEVNITNVDAVVTDRTNAHVHGLSKDDFVLYDNGVPQPITNFSEYRGGVLEMSVAPAGEPAENGPDLPAASHKRPVAILIFIDNLHLQMKNRSRALNAIFRFLDAHQEDPLDVMLVRWNGRMRTKPIRGSAREIAAVLPRLLTESADEMIQVRERRRLMQRIDEASLSSLDERAQILQSVRSYAESVRREAEDTVEALNASVNSIRGFDGRRVLLFISDGVPQMAGEELFHYWAAKFGRIAAGPADPVSTINLEPFQYDLTRTFQRAGDAANAAGVTFYSLDATGVGSEELFAVDSAHFDGSQLNAPAMRDNRLGMMNYMAHITGGTFIKDENEFDAAIESIGSDLRDYYSFGYRTPPGGKVHNIDVRIKRAGLRVRARQQYAVITSEQKILSQIESVLGGKFSGPNPLGLVVKSAPLPGQEQTHRISISMRVPRQGLTPIAGGQVTLYLAAMDADGNTTPIRSVIRKVPDSGDLLGFFELKLRPGPASIVAGARDDLSGTLSLVRFDANP
jgi:VWFA-related protein